LNDIKQGLRRIALQCKHRLLINRGVQNVQHIVGDGGLIVGKCRL
jgi:hypothetical protein